MATPGNLVSKDDISITSLADQVSRLSTSIASYIDDNGHAQPNFTATSAPVPDSLEYEGLRNQLNDAVLDLHRLVNGPLNIFRTQSFGFGDMAALQVALTRKYFEHIPEDDIGLTAAEIANKSGMDEDRTTRLLKMLATQRIFEEVDGKFRHTASSHFLRTSVFSAMVQITFEDVFKGASEMNTWIDASQHPTGLQDSPFYTKFGMTFYEFLEADPEKAVRFSNAMTAWSLVDRSFTVLRGCFDWSSLTNTKVVDIAGGNGHVSVDLARDFPALTFTVQDLYPQQLSSSQNAEFQDRVKFQKYDYFTPQPICDAGIYLYRIAFHNHHDDDAVKMLKSLVPALEDRDDDPRLLINDSIVPERAEGEVTKSEENRHRALDLIMLTLFGAKERTEKNWQELFGRVDQRLEIVKIHYNPSGAGLLEARLKREGDRVTTP